MKQAGISFEDIRDEHGDLLPEYVARIGALFDTDRATQAEQTEHAAEIIATMGEDLREAADIMHHSDQETTKLIDGLREELREAQAKIDTLTATLKAEQDKAAFYKEQADKWYKAFETSGERFDRLLTTNAAPIGDQGGAQSSTASTSWTAKLRALFKKRS